MLTAVYTKYCCIYYTKYVSYLYPVPLVLTLCCTAAFAVRCTAPDRYDLHPCTRRYRALKGGWRTLLVVPSLSPTRVFIIINQVPVKVNYQPRFSRRIRAAVSITPSPKTFAFAFNENKQENRGGRCDGDATEMHLHSTKTFAGDENKIKRGGRSIESNRQGGAAQSRTAGVLFSKAPHTHRSHRTHIRSHTHWSQQTFPPDRGKLKISENSRGCLPPYHEPTNCSLDVPFDTKGRQR